MLVSAHLFLPITYAYACKSTCVWLDVDVTALDTKNAI